MKLVKGKKIVVYFGYLYEVDLPKQSSSEEKKKPEIESQSTFFANEKEEVIKERNKMLEALNANREVRAVSDLFRELPSDLLYNPIFFKIHLPLSLQKLDYVMSKSVRSCTEDFECVYGGGVLFIAALCDIDKEPYGVYDVRDRVLKVLESITKIKVVPPCLFNKPIVFAMKKEMAKQDGYSLFEIATASSSKVLLRELFDMIGYALDAFYEINSLSYGVSEQVEKIENKTVKLLKAMVGSSKNGWKRKFGVDNHERRKDIINILADVSECQSDNNLRKRKMRDFKMLLYDNPISTILSLNDLKFYGEPYQKLDTESVLKTLELVRNELDSYSRNRFALLSAFTGALVGSMVTLILSHI